MWTFWAKGPQKRNKKCFTEHSVGREIEKKRSQRLSPCRTTSNSFRRLDWFPFFRAVFQLLGNKLIISRCSHRVWNSLNPSKATHILNYQMLYRYQIKTLKNSMFHPECFESDLKKPSRFFSVKRLTFGNWAPSTESFFNWSKIRTSATTWEFERAICVVKQQPSESIFTKLRSNTATDWWKAVPYTSVERWLFRNPIKLFYLHGLEEKWKVIFHWNDWLFLRWYFWFMKNLVEQAN